MNTIILIISFLWAFLEGKREAQYFHYKWSLPKPTRVKDEHLHFTIQRSLYVILSSIVAGLFYYWWVSFIMFISISFCFSFFHNGSYYLRRNQLNSEIYKKRWFGESNTTTAKISFSYKTRLILFIIGTLITLSYDILHLIK